MVKNCDRGLENTPEAVSFLNLTRFFPKGAVNTARSSIT